MQVLIWSTFMSIDADECAHVYVTDYMQNEYCKHNLHIEYVCMYNVYVYLRQCDRKYISTLTTPRGTLEANAHALIWDSRLAAHVVQMQMSDTNQCNRERLQVRHFLRHCL